MSKSFEDIVELSRFLRSPQGCPWDREQTLSSIKKYILEEAYEVIQAIELNNKDELVEEMGDFLFQAIFASQIASEEGIFDINDVLDQLHNKLIRRHPHVFGEKKAKDANEAVKSWHTQKMKEKSGEKRLLEIPRSMPSLLRAQRVGEKASQVGFDWDNISDVLSKVKEELNELEIEIKKGDRVNYKKEFGDLIFSLVNLSRHLKIDAESESHTAIDKFIKRFSILEDMAKESKRPLADMSIEEMEALWQEVKEEV
ncbi:MAG: nucleoside triphosphate pyrophosphohydrolase [Candidatus Dadabacteria bacterium]|nr:nucleoside triphosphate pyrophosphohydrolase [Candidatus Dadabacteria bacterium]NIQ14525.1 nucleoside triphosphate pyrophosphohydrolase [Candidatus Dadabacteria bacterium]